MSRLSPKNEDKVDFAEFVDYVVEHEKRLQTIFEDLDRNRDGLLNCIRQVC